MESSAALSAPPNVSLEPIQEKLDAIEPGRGSCCFPLSFEVVILRYVEANEYMGVPRMEMEHPIKVDD